MTFIELLCVALVGGTLGLDAVGVGQVMVSRPIVAATLAGLVFGSPGHGLIVGAILEMLAMETMPFGASRYLEWSAGSIVAAVVIVKVQGITAPELLIALIFALGTAWLAGASMVVLRKINGQLVARRRTQLDAGKASAIVSLQVSGIVLDFIRGALIATTAVMIAVPISRAFVAAVIVSDRISAGVIIALPTAVALAACWRMFASASRRRILVLGGALLGAALVLAQ